MSEQKTSIPKWILFYGGFLALLGLVVGVIGVLSPTAFFIDFPNFTQWGEIDFVTNGWGVRSFVMGAVMVMALMIKSPGAIGLAFAMRFMTETGNLLNSLMTGHGTMGAPAIALTIGWVALFLIPEALAAKWGFRTYFAGQK